MKTFLLAVALMLTASSAFALESDGVVYASEVKPVVVVQKQIVQAQADGDSLRVSALQDELARLQSKINQLAHRKVSVAEIEAVAKKMGYYGPPDKWAQPDVDQAVSSGRMVGREPGRNASENAWKAPAKREEVAIVANRVADEAQTNLKNHNNDANAHPGIMARLASLERSLGILYWLLVGLLVLALLIGLIALFRWIFRRAQGGGQWAYPGVNNPGMTTAPRGFTPLENGTGNRWYNS